MVVFRELKGENVACTYARALKLHALRTCMVEMRYSGNKADSFKKQLKPVETFGNNDVAYSHIVH